MPNYGLVVNNKFKPFEYQELLAPVLAATQAQRELEEAYTTMAEKASVWDKLTEGSAAHNTYAEFNEALEQAADDLSKNGITPSSRQEFLKLRKRFAEDIAPIELAYKRKESNVAAQNALRKDPTYMFQVNASDVPLEEYINNPSLDVITNGYSGALLAKQVGEAASEISKELVNYESGRSSNINSLAQYYGVKTEDIAKAIREARRNPATILDNEVLNTIVETVIDASGIKEWADQETLERAYLWAYQGLWKAVGGDKVSGFNAPSSKSTTSVSSAATNSGVETMPEGLTPSLIPNKKPSAASSNSSSKPSTNTSSRLSGRYQPRKKAYGGSLNIYAPGGGMNQEAVDDKDTKMFQFSPAFEAALAQYSDDEIDSLISERSGVPIDKIDAVTADSTLKVLDKEYVDRLVETYRDSLFSTTFVEPNYTYTPVYTDKDEQELLADAKAWDMYKQYFYKNGNRYFLTQAGRDLYNSNNIVNMYSPSIGRTLSYSRKSDFKNWLDSKGLGDMGRGIIYQAQTDKIVDMLSRINGQVYDATKSAELERYFDSDQIPDIKSRLLGMSKQGKLANYTRVKDKDAYTFQSAQSIDASEIEDIKSARAVVGLHGSFLEVTLKDGTKVKIPGERFDAKKMEYINSILGNVADLEKRRKNGRYEWTREDGKTVHINNEIARELNNATDTFVSMFGNTSVEKLKVQPGIYR